MHHYANVFKHTASVHGILAGLAYALYLGLAQLPLSAFLSLGPMATLTIFAVLEFIFERWAWRLLTAFPALGAHDFAGEFAGMIKTGDGPDYPARVEIRQSWSQMVVEFESGEGDNLATSRSFSASIVANAKRTGSVELVYNYEARGTRNGAGGVSAHFGTTRLQLSSRDKQLSGTYYTEHDRNSFGRIELVRVGNGAGG